MRRLLLLTLPLVLLACQPPAPRLAGAGMDMFAPVKIRLHPLSRIVLATTVTATAPAGGSGVMLEAHVELSDQFADAGKGAGQILIELFDSTGGIGGGRKGALLGSWNESINTPESNRDHWDRTTRTYVFKFPLAANTMSRDRDRVLLSATLTLPNGEALSHELVLPLR